MNFIFNEDPDRVSKKPAFCSLHFTTDSVTNRAQFDMGFSKRLKLKDNVVLNILDLGVSRYTGIDDNRNIQSNDYRYRVNLVCDDIPLLAITAIFKMNRTDNTTCKCKLSCSSNGRAWC